MNINNDEMKQIREFEDDFTDYQYYRECGALDGNHEIIIYEKDAAHLLHLNALRKKLSDLRWPCGKCGGCGLSVCPHTLTITLHAPEIWQKWQSPCREKMKIVEAAYEKALYAVTLNALGESLSKVGLKNQQLQHGKIIIGEAHQLYREVMPDFFKVLDENTELQDRQGQ